MVKISNRQYAQALYEITKNLKGADLDDALKAFVGLLIRDHKLKQAHHIIEEFERVAKQSEGIVELEITSAHELDSTTINHVKKAFGQKVEAVSSVDKSLIGGVKVKLGDKILDASLKTQLHNLKNHLV